ncbi:hypothetical protein PY365_32690 [Roseiarcaceae bacterium H3SJ34-1]|uniref:hypothetical protein n=1 Tax=Terripilifer ovatus TaxID=3032367 RepID=UPI003AB987A6|nr:hypothetical protein [Roseiarcaceae bacterium H3SJ34-1]
MVTARLAELEAEIDRQEARLSRAIEANVVALHPATIAVYLDAVEQLAKALSASDAKAACLKLRELIDCIVVAPRVKPGDPIHLEVRGRLAALTQPDPGLFVSQMVPRGGLKAQACSALKTLEKSSSAKSFVHHPRCPFNLFC